MPSPVERWMEYVNLRIGTAHDYSREKAAAAPKRMDDFLADAIALFQTITGEECDVEANLIRPPSSCGRCWI